jgi:hypothetical protein
MDDILGDLLVVRFEMFWTQNRASHLLEKKHTAGHGHEEGEGPWCLNWTGPMNPTSQPYLGPECLELCVVCPLPFSSCDK